MINATEVTSTQVTRRDDDANGIRKEVRTTPNSGFVKMNHENMTARSRKMTLEGDVKNASSEAAAPSAKPMLAFPDAPFFFMLTVWIPATFLTASPIDERHNAEERVSVLMKSGIDRIIIDAPNSILKTSRFSERKKLARR